MASKAAIFASYAEECGWEVDRIKDGDYRTVEATRGTESLICTWVGDKVIGELGEYWIGEEQIRKIPNAAAGRRILEAEFTPPKPKSQPQRKLTGEDMQDMTPEEILEAISGHKVTWVSEMTGKEETYTVPLNGSKTQVLAGYYSPDEWYVTFCDAEGGGYRTFRLKNLIKIGRKVDARGDMLLNTRHIGMLAMQKGRG